MKNSLFQEVEVQGSPPRRSGIFTIPFLLLLLLIGLFFWVGRDAFMYSRKVDVAKVRLAQGKVVVTKETGGTLFQAAGWIEARPYPIRITALTGGVVKKIYVVAGQKVEKGQLIAELIDEDLVLSLREAQIKLKELQSKYRIKKTRVLMEIANKEQLFSERKTALTILARLEHQERLLHLSQVGIAKLEKEQAAFLVKEQSAKVDEFVAQKKVMEQRIQLARQEVEEIKQQMKRQQVQIDKIALNIKRLRIVASQDGIIQRLYVREGRKQLLEADNEMSTTVAEMFDPEFLQVRVDVPLYEIPKVRVEQKTLISVEAHTQPIEGVVAFLGGQADYQKNTLEVKVYIKDPPPILRPEMLAQVQFLQEAKTEKQLMSQALFIHKDCLLSDGEKNYVWIVTLENHLQRRMIEYNGEQDDWVAVTEGLSAGEQVVLGEKNSLNEGEKVQVRRRYE